MIRLLRTRLYCTECKHKWEYPLRGIVALRLAQWYEVQKGLTCPNCRHKDNHIAGVGKKDQK